MTRHRHRKQEGGGLGRAVVPPKSLRALLGRREQKDRGTHKLHLQVVCQSCARS